MPPVVNGLLSVVIPNWNGAHFLPPCLDSLRAQRDAEIEVIVADNASHDTSRALLRERYSWVRLVGLPVNRGFTGACNAGMAFARGEFIALLNNDTEVEAGWAAAVIAAFRQHPEAGSIASKMLLYNARDTLHTAGDFYTTDGRAGNRGVWQPDAPPYDQPAEVFSACGGSAVYRRAMLDEIGLLDDQLFFLLEDVDLGWRARLAGWRCLYTPDAVVYHHLSATGGGVTASFYDGRNSLWVLARNMPGPLLRQHALPIALRQARIALEAARAWRGAAARARLRGMLAGLVGLPRQLGRRRALQAGVRVADIAQALSPPEMHP